MKIAVYGATGNIGSRIVTEALRRGHHVTALSRREPTTPVPEGAVWQAGDLADADGVAAVAAAHDVVVTATGPSRVPGEDPFAFAPLIRGAAAVVGATRFFVVGGAGSLLAAPGVRLVDTAEFPEAYKSESLAGAQVLEFLRGADDSLDWGYLSPAPMIEAGERTGSYAIADEVPAGNWISYEDYAVAALDELEEPAHRRARFTVATR
ncbi:MAG TPA: NAD(P)H-binding protein [Jatrophihabitans sp.]|jgi:hypothetical protein|uniref:NAD(P)-dependent oxidoreductase n=1 Tax=Jatrophihabitans sp. TaxID=1932789 RepID=UPI002DFEA06C|nr:NAD(P)H-binding protein [Jatrophihabitans sp.]